MNLDCKVIFSFRWILSGSDFPLDFTKSIQIDFINKELKTSNYLLKDKYSIDQWVTDYADKDITLHLSRYDGQGKIITWQDITGVKIISYNENLLAKEDGVTIINADVVLSFQQVNTINGKCN